MKAATDFINAPLPPFFGDHRISSRPALAAVEAMERLAAEACHRSPGTNGRRLTNVRFDRLLYLDHPDPPAVANRVERTQNGSIRMTLTTRFKSPGSTISRTLTHVAASIGDDSPDLAGPPLETAACLTGRCTTVEPDRIYREIIPFGPAYRNIKTPLLISTDGALARVGSPQPGDPRRSLCLGSPYVLDAAFHAACVWCSLFCGVVAFPVSIERRSVIRPTRLEATYTARVLPVQTKAEPLVFDIFVYDDEGNLCEAVSGIHMREIGAGRTGPPTEFRPPVHNGSLGPIEDQVSAMVLLERNTVSVFAAAALSENERRRLTPMAPGRAKEYLSARLALKRLSRQLSGPDDRRRSREIETVVENTRRPQCPLADGQHPFCAVSHDRRFTVAVAADRSVGVDVEPLSERPLKAMHLYMEADEQTLVNHSFLGRPAAALRAWSAKEAAAKALGIDLNQAWTRVRISDIDSTRSRLSIDGKTGFTARHAVLENHLLTLLKIADRR